MASNACTIIGTIDSLFSPRNTQLLKNLSICTFNMHYSIPRCAITCMHPYSLFSSRCMYKYLSVVFFPPCCYIRLLMSCTRGERLYTGSDLLCLCDSTPDQYRQFRFDSRFQRSSVNSSETNLPEYLRRRNTDKGAPTCLNIHWSYLPEGDPPSRLGHADLSPSSPPFCF